MRTIATISLLLMLAGCSKEPEYTYTARYSLAENVCTEVQYGTYGAPYETVTAEGCWGVTMDVKDGDRCMFIVRTTDYPVTAFLIIERDGEVIAFCCLAVMAHSQGQLTQLL